MARETGTIKPVARRQAGVVVIALTGNARRGEAPGDVVAIHAADARTGDGPHVLIPAGPDKHFAPGASVIAEATADEIAAALAGGKTVAAALTPFADTAAGKPLRCRAAKRRTDLAVAILEKRAAAASAQADAMRAMRARAFARTIATGVAADFHAAEATQTHVAAITHDAAILENHAIDARAEKARPLQRLAEASDSAVSKTEGPAT